MYSDEMARRWTIVIAVFVAVMVIVICAAVAYETGIRVIAWW